MTKRIKLGDCISHIYILAYKEDTSKLEKSLKNEGFLTEVIRPIYSKKELTYSRSSRCLLNHKNAWVECTKGNGLFMVVEADFVPVKGLRNLPLPFDIDKSENTWGFLYSCAQRFYELDNNGFARGHSAAPVATVISPEAAKVLINFVSNEFSVHSPKEYTPWDTYIRMYAQKNGVNTYIPFRSYGEHGGIPNIEHSQAHINPSHQADVIWGRLYFLPAYASDSKIKFVYFRAIAKTRALARLVSGRYIETALLKSSNISIRDKMRMISFSVKRLIYPF